MNATTHEPARPIPTDPDMIRQLVEEQNEVERLETMPEHPPPGLMPEQTRVRGYLTREPAPAEPILIYKDSPLIVRQTVGAFFAQGGTSKTFLVLHLAFAMASGGRFGPLKAPGPLKVLVLAGEDPQPELDRRLWRIGQGNFPTNLHVFSVAGFMGPLMELREGNPVKGKWFDYLVDTIQNHAGLDVLILDPKSRFYGLDENNNDHATQWVSALESLAKDFGLTVLFTHHTSKSRANDQDQHVSRGASAIVDGIRWAASMRPVLKGTADKYGIENPSQYIELEVVKTNYAAKPARSFYFQRKQDGTLRYAALEMDQKRGMAQTLCRLLSEAGEEYTLSELKKKKKCKAISDSMKESFPKFVRGKDFDAIVHWAFQNGWIEHAEAGTSQNPRQVIRLSGWPGNGSGIDLNGA